MTEECSVIIINENNRCVSKHTYEIEYGYEREVILELILVVIENVIELEYYEYYNWIYFKYNKKNVNYELFVLAEPDTLFQDYPILNDVLVNLEKLEILKLGTRFLGEFRVESLYQNLPDSLKQIVLLDNMCSVERVPMGVQVIRSCSNCYPNVCLCNDYKDSFDNIVDITLSKEHEYYDDPKENEYLEIDFDDKLFNEINRCNL